MHFFFYLPISNTHILSKNYSIILKHWLNYNDQFNLGISLFFKIYIEMEPGLGIKGATMLSIVVVVCGNFAVA